MQRGQQTARTEVPASQTGKIWQRPLWGGPKTRLKPKTRYSGHLISLLSRIATQLVQTKGSATYMKRSQKSLKGLESASILIEI